MMHNEVSSSPVHKRRRLNVAATTGAASSSSTANVESQNTSWAIERPISPPISLTRVKKSRTPPPPSIAKIEADAKSEGHVTKRMPATRGTSMVPESTNNHDGSDQVKGKEKETSDDDVRYLRSPIQLTRIKDMSADENIDTVGLGDILGDPSIRECWCFNFLFDVEFVVNQFHPNNKDIVKLNIVHGFWKKEDRARIYLTESASQYHNVNLIQAYIPDPFGTHHSKMMILFRYDSHAQIIIHTANMIPRDWGNMTQGIWRSPWLPMKVDFLEGEPATSQPGRKEEIHSIGSGERFRVDLFGYLAAYGKRLNGLTSQLVGYDFSGIRAAFLASAPSRHRPGDAKPKVQTSFGWLGLKEILTSILVKEAGNKKHDRSGNTRPNIIMQVSSIATLGPTTTWLEHFQSVLSSHANTLTSTSTPTSVAQMPSNLAAFFTKASLLPRSPVAKRSSQTPTFNIIFPTPDEIRTSIDGYASGSSIHTKIQSAQQQKQLEYLRPIFCHWKGSSPSALTSPLESPANVPLVKREALRGPAAPHIKTYLRFSDDERKTIDWALLTSANMSKQAWGDVVSKKGDIWIQSWEVGVLVWPELFGSGKDGVDDVVMVPLFGKDMPGVDDLEVGDGGDVRVKVKKVVRDGDRGDIEAIANSDRAMRDPDETEDEEEEEGLKDPDETEDEEEEEEVKDLDKTEDEIDPDETEDEEEEDAEQARQTKPRLHTRPQAQSKPMLTQRREKTVIGFRLPYDLPLNPYGSDEVPWCATLPYQEPDRKGQAWEGY